jgi:hypothetical protein
MAAICAYDLIEIWMKWWAASNDVHPNNALAKWVGVFAAFVTTALMTLGLTVWYVTHVLS